jgi:hypothetical protein
LVKLSRSVFAVEDTGCKFLDEQLEMIAMSGVGHGSESAGLGGMNGNDQTTSTSASVRPLNMYKALPSFIRNTTAATKLQDSESQSRQRFFKEDDGVILLDDDFDPDDHDGQKTPTAEPIATKTTSAPAKTSTHVAVTSSSLSTPVSPTLFGGIVYFLNPLLGLSVMAKVVFYQLNSQKLTINHHIYPIPFGIVCIWLLTVSCGMH